MEKKKGFGSRVEAFFNGKGFYIVLFLCIAVIGVSTWAMLGGTGTNVETSAIKTREQTTQPVRTEGPREVPPVAQESQTTGEQESRVTIEATERVAEVEEVAETTIGADEPETPVWNEQVEQTERETVQQVPESTAVSFIWPLAGEVTTPYSTAMPIYNLTMADWRIHTGVDIAAELGTVVMAVSTGTVENVYRDDMYGVTVVIKHRDELRSIYSNLADIPTVYVGDSVFGGEIIGAVGNTALGESGRDSEHLHFCMTTNNRYIDPREMLP